MNARAGGGAGEERAALRSCSARFRHCLSSRNLCFALLLMLLPADEAMNGVGNAPLRSYDEIRSSLMLPRREFGGGGVVFVSGAAAFKGVVACLLSVFERTTHVMPVSDDGGSSAEIRRVFGGPGIGDIRARLVKMARAGVVNVRGKKKGVIDLMSLRLNPTHEKGARDEWDELLAGKHFVLATLEDEELRSRCLEVLNYFNKYAMDRCKEKGIPPISLTNGSVGNFLLTGLWLILGLQPAIEWASLQAGVPTGAELLPAADPPGDETWEQYAGGANIAAELESGKTIMGQNEISHPHLYPRGMDVTLTRAGIHRIQSVEKELCGSAETPTDSPIARIFFQQPAPRANRDFMSRVRTAKAVVFGPGSLYTSILPCLIMEGVGEAVGEMHDGAVRALLLNSCPDRETAGMSASEHVQALADGMCRYGELKLPVHRLVNVVVVPEGSSVPVDSDVLNRMGVRVVECPCRCAHHSHAGGPTTAAGDDEGEKTEVAGAEGHIGHWKAVHTASHRIGEFCSELLGGLMHNLVEKAWKSAQCD